MVYYRYIIIIYPLKRYTHWPQLGLGLAFNWGVLIVSVEFLGNITFDFLLLYIACIFWTLAYDTIYAYQDKEDDIQNNIKSTAVLLVIRSLLCTVFLCYFFYNNWFFRLYFFKIFL